MNFDRHSYFVPPVRCPNGLISSRCHPDVPTFFQATGVSGPSASPVAARCQQAVLQMQRQGLRVHYAGISQADGHYQVWIDGPDKTAAPQFVNECRVRPIPGGTTSHPAGFDGSRSVRGPGAQQGGASQLPVDVAESRLSSILAINGVLGDIIKRMAPGGIVFVVQYDPNQMSMAQSLPEQIGGYRVEYQPSGS